MPALHNNLRRLLAIRSIVFACQLVALLINALFLHLALPYLPVSVLLGLFAVMNVAVFLRLRLDRPVTEAEFLGHLLLDVAGFSLLLYFTGGATNPFVSYLLVPVMIAAATLSAFYTWGIALAALAAYSLLLFRYVPLPDLMPDPPAMHGEGMGQPEEFSLHILGMWANFMVSAGLITWFVVKMAGELREQQKQIADLRESTLRNEQILGVAIQAAGTAHALGTPLSTMAVVLRDLHEEETDEQKRKDLALLQQQLGLCRQAIRDMVDRQEPGSGAGPVPVRLFLDQLLDHWQLLRPEAQLRVTRDQKEATHWLAATDGLQQAVINLLNNAADAGGDSIELGSEVNDGMWHLGIRDFGVGLTDDLRKRLGLEVVSTKQQGMGVGFMLSHATVERLGGRVSLQAAAGSGTLTSIRLPVTSGKAVKSEAGNPASDFGGSRESEA